MAVGAIVALVAAACSSKGTTGGGGSPSGNKTKVGMVYDLVGRGDKSFNDAAYSGLLRASQQLPITYKELTPDSKGTNREALMRLLATQGYPFIVGNGFLFADTVNKLAKEFPKVDFAVTDGSAAAAPNVVNMDFAENEGSYLAGVASALKTKTNHIGFIGGVDTSLIHKFDKGYAAGAKSVKPNIKIDVKYISAPPDFSGFNNPAKGHEIALAMYQSGADIVYAAAGGSGTGMFQAASEFSAKGKKVWGIGVDSDQYQTVPQYKDFVLTSMIKHVEVAIFNTIKAFVDKSFKSGTSVFDLKAGGVGLSYSGGFINDIKSQIDAAAQKITSGQITVPCGGAGC